MFTSRLPFRMCLLLYVSLPVMAAAQNSPPAAYDVSSVKPHDPDDHNMSWHLNRDGVSVVNANLRNVIASAWDVRMDQVTGEPAWADDLHWDVTGKSTELTPEQLKSLTSEQRHEMMQQLMAERFHLRAHLETRTGPVFTLVPAKGGIKLKPITVTPEDKSTGKTPGGWGLSTSGDQAVVMEAKKISLSMFIGNLAANLHQTVIDKTGLPADAVYDFTLRWAPDYGPAPTADSDAPPLPAALQDQLGLRLETSRGPVQVLVVDHVEKPSVN